MLFHLLSKLLTFSLLLHLITSRKPQNVLDISDYPYPHPEDSSSSNYTIALFATNDFHGYAFPSEYTDPRNNETYSRGGIEYIGTVVDILRDEWDDRFIWLDGGDHGSGGYEYTLSNGKIMTDFFNFKNLTASALGNHAFNYGIDFLHNQTKNSTFDYLCANIMEKSTMKREFFNNHHKSKIYNVGKVKVGVIGLTHIKVAKESNKVGKLSFLPYRDIILEESEKLKSEGADAVILLAHFGPFCGEMEGFEDKYILRVRNEKDRQVKCTELDGILELLESLPLRTIDALVAGHIHEISHHWVKHIPIVSSIGALYSNALYLTFKKTPKGKFHLLTSQIEGPIPICSKVFSKARHCKRLDDYSIPDLGDLTDFSFHGVTMRADAKVSHLIQKWKDLMRPLKTPLCYNEMLLKRDPSGENTLHNIVVDAFKRRTQSDVALVHVDGLRTKWVPGGINKLDLFNMFPFENYVCSFDMTGEELLRTLNDIVGKKFYSVSGLMVTYSRQPKKFISALEYNGGKYNEIDKNKMYKVASLDYLIKGNVEFAKVMKWYKPRNYKCFETIREVVERYLKEIRVIKANDFYDPLHPRNNFIN